MGLGRERRVRAWVRVRVRDETSRVRERNEGYKLKKGGKFGKRGKN